MTECDVVAIKAGTIAFFQIDQVINSFADLNKAAWIVVIISLIVGFRAFIM